MKDDGRDLLFEGVAVLYFGTAAAFLFWGIAEAVLAWLIGGKG